MVLRKFLKTIQSEENSLSSNALQDERTCGKMSKIAENALEGLPHAPLHMEQL
jgi:hypothetical protein